MPQKLQLYSIRGIALKLFESYLKFRHHSVSIEKHRSDSRKQNASVPQGSIFEPRLFHIYINDLIDMDSKGSMIIYADDTSILFSGSDISEIIETVYSFLEKLNVSATLNSLNIKSNKTKAVILGRRQSRLSIIKPTQ